MDLRQLRFFLEVARCGSFTRATERLHISQPALSIAIRKLEEELEVRLFNRRDRKITLTAEGEVLARHAREIQRKVTLARQELADLRGLLKGEVRIGLTPMLSSCFLPKIISAFKQRYPALQISISGDSAWNLSRQIEQGKIDMGIIAGPVPEGFDSHHLLRDEVVACVPRNHPFARRGHIPIRELLSEPLIHFKTGYHLREMIDALAEQEGMTPMVVAESNLFSLIVNLVKEELGLAFLLRMMVTQDTQLAALSCSTPLYLDLAIAWKKNTGLSRANHAFVEFLIEEVDDYYLLAQAASTFPLP
ncbi:MAG: LysR family transcriptional regulator [Desulfuromonas sp.]